MPDHPIEALMKTTMESIKEMVDVNTILGDPVETPDGTVVLPVSRVTFGFAAGGSEFPTGDRQAGQGTAQRNQAGQGGAQTNEQAGGLPFGGGAGAGITVQPVAFLVVGQGQIRALPVDGGAIIDRLIDVVPSLLGQISGRKRQAEPQASPPRPNVQGAVQ
ncbi:MAG: GerW family sporulation protein [Bacillota bacterium]